MDLSNLFQLIKRGEPESDSPLLLEPSKTGSQKCELFCYLSRNSLEYSLGLVGNNPDKTPTKPRPESLRRRIYKVTGESLLKEDHHPKKIGASAKAATAPARSANKQQATA